MVLAIDDGLELLIKVLQPDFVELDTERGGILAMLATTCSMSCTVISRDGRSVGDSSFTAAPTSSMTSIALSGNRRSVMCSQTAPPPLRWRRCCK